jgi:hypothetical protein
MSDTPIDWAAAERTAEIVVQTYCDLTSEQLKAIPPAQGLAREDTLEQARAVLAGARLRKALSRALEEMSRNDNPQIYAALLAVQQRALEGSV